jgi:hypothetical protein
LLMNEGCVLKLELFVSWNWSSGLIKIRLWICCLVYIVGT